VRRSLVADPVAIRYRLRTKSNQIELNLTKSSFLAISTPIFATKSAFSAFFEIYDILFTEYRIPNAIFQTIQLNF